jgi:hypothetical protein
MDQPILPGIPCLPPFSTDNPREIRIICALAGTPCSREELDRIAGASNVPDAIASLRHAGLEIPCERSPATDKDGEIVYRGRYRFTDADRERTMHVWGRLA